MGDDNTTNVTHEGPPSILCTKEEGGVLLFASSYFEYIRLSGFLKSQDSSFCRIGEVTSQQDISRARLWFLEGQKKILLYSERSHLFHGYKIRGGHHLVVYSLPGRKDFYPEVCIN
ncbi:hypothetical protein VPH35_050336 [Triticum aestivum]|uniref:UTP25 C-terminal domain-containing protein n=1 Tax=Triticum turgidum subsp. durum TaxID=4567 RepID=A0A9R1RY32_TRITD|nr:unnamed protein product [Triticum turgidum subsp. durum]